MQPLNNEKAAGMTDEVKPKWRQLAEAMQREQDPDKVLELVEKLNEELAKADEATLDAAFTPRKRKLKPRQ